MIRTNHNQGFSREACETVMPAEWHRQRAVQLTWPHPGTDWAPMLDDVEECYIRMAREIAKREQLIIVCPDSNAVRGLLESHLDSGCISRIVYCEMPTNDTWARDHGFITLLSPEGPLLLDFRFNGWGQKFASDLDNQICRQMAGMQILKGRYSCHLDFVLEGGSVESDGKGSVLTTAKCLAAPNRNEPLTLQDIEQRLKSYLHARRILWLHHGGLEGDDTDSHVDTLARFCPNDTIAYVKCEDRNDPHFEELHLMEKELSAFRTEDGKPYRLISLPMAPKSYDLEGNRLPATYANFLVVNGAVLMPTYGDKVLDTAAALQLGKAFPRHEIVPVDCRSLIVQHGSLHCCTMQFPEEVEITASGSKCTQKT